MKLQDVYRIKAKVANGVSNKEIIAVFSRRYSEDEIKQHLPKRSAPKKKKAKG